MQLKTINPKTLGDRLIGKMVTGIETHSDTHGTIMSLYLTVDGEKFNVFTAEEEWEEGHWK